MMNLMWFHKNRTFMLLVFATTWCGVAISYMLQYFEASSVQDASRLTALASVQQQPEETLIIRTKDIVVAGLARDTNEIRNSTWSLLVELSCRHNVAIHITTQSSHISPSNRDDKRFCAPFLLETQDEMIMMTALTMGEQPRQETRLLSDNRINRLAQLRDIQRQRIGSLFFPTAPAQPGEPPRPPGTYDRETSLVMLLDLDLWSFPSANKIIRRAESMNHMQVVCGAGNWLDNPEKKLLYYDNFALVYWPDTFAFSKNQRLIPTHYAGENVDIVHRENTVVQETKGTEVIEKIIPGFSQYDMFAYIRKEARQSPSKLTPVRSCFGGLAMYEANVWLNPICQYKLILNNGIHSTSSSIFRYASKAEGFPCEHVVFHECLHRHVFQDPPPSQAELGSGSVTPDEPKPHMAIDPFLITHWRKNEDIAMDIVRAKEKLLREQKAEEKRKKLEFFAKFRQRHRKKLEAAMAEGGQEEGNKE